MEIAAEEDDIAKVIQEQQAAKDVEKHVSEVEQGVPIQPVAQYIAQM